MQINDLSVKQNVCILFFGKGAECIDLRVCFVFRVPCTFDGNHKCIELFWGYCSRRGNVYFLQNMGMCHSYLKKYFFRFGKYGKNMEHFWNNVYNYLCYTKKPTYFPNILTK